MCPLVDTGLTDLPKTGGRMNDPLPPACDSPAIGSSAGRTRVLTSFSDRISRIVISHGLKSLFCVNWNVLRGQTVMLNHAETLIVWRFFSVGSRMVWSRSWGIIPDGLRCQPVKFNHAISHNCKVQLFWKGHKYLLSKCPNHEVNCANFHGLLRKAEFYLMPHDF